LVEGIWDAITLWHLLPGHGAVAASLGAELSQAQAYELRDKTVFVLYDADHTGYTHARKVAETLKEFEANPIIVDFPGKNGKDLNEAYLRSSAWLSTWVKEQVSRYDRADTTYVDRLFSGEQEHLAVLPTGIVQWDRFMGGGFRPGVHVLGAEPGVGKTSLVTDIAERFAMDGKRVLFVTQEISKRQQWARFASKRSKRSWMYLETEPEALEKSVRKHMATLAKSVRVVAGWNVNQIEFVAPHYDVVIVDYLQRMPGPFKQDNVKANVDYNIEYLSNLGRDQGKVVLAVSSFNRASYRRDEITIEDFKESGNIEYVAVSLVGFRRPANDVKIHGSVVKNTRGRKGMFFMEADLAHQSFKDAKMEQPTPAKQQADATKKTLRSAKDA
jgi:nucleoside-triphosphatase THEP1